MNPVAENLHPSLQVIDSTKIKGFQTCRRKFFFEHILGWNKKEESHDLWYGQAVHFAFEHIYRKWQERGKSGYQERDIAEGFSIFLEHYRQMFPADTDIAHPAKNPEQTIKMLLLYAETYAQDAFQVVETEISGSVLIGEYADGREKRIYFRLDTVTLDERGYSILEHKTSKWNKDLWRASFRFATQPGTGNHLLWSLYGGTAEGVNCLKLNGIFLQAPLKTKERPAAEFLRVPMKMSGRAMQAWLEEVNEDYDNIQHDIMRLEKCEVGDPVMKAFKRNPDGCVQFNRICPYMDFCEAYHNPLQHPDPPTGFTTRHWDPRELDTSYTKKVEV